jgi:hypothetical protein
MANIAAQLGGKAPGHNWCSRFVQRHKSELDSRYLDSLDLNRHEADSVASFEMYFSVVGKKMEEYNLLPENTYNMDEKGFLLGRITKAKRVFPKGLLSTTLGSRNPLVAGPLMRLASSGSKISSTRKLGRKLEDNGDSYSSTATGLTSH